MEWETIDDNHQRSPIYGGWLVKAFEWVMHHTDMGLQGGWDTRISMCFVPDPNHEWKI